MNLTTPIGQIPGIGPAYQSRLRKMGIKTVRDIIFHFPHRYEDFSNIIPIARVELNQNCCILGKILEIKNSRTWRRKMFLTQAIIQDKSGAIKVVWFNQPYLIKTLKPNEFISLAGKTSLGDDGLYLANPAYEKISGFVSHGQGLTHTGRLVPVYPETEGLSSRWFRYILKPLLAKLKSRIPDPLPVQIKNGFRLIEINKAIWQIHFPDSIELAKKAQDRFSFEELFYIELFVLRERLRLAKEKALAVPIKLATLQKFVRSLPFKLTDAQKKCAWRILKDMEKPRPMNRLLEGDVGSGKTVVAAIAALNVVKNGGQVAFMAPTEILAKQHFRSVSRLLANFGLNIGLLTGKEDKFISKKLKNETVEISREKLLEKARGKIDLCTKKISTGVDILIGTHALIQDKVRFGKLGLVILDEQHRFGVEQRARLCSASATATADKQGYGGQAKLIQRIFNHEQKTIMLPHLVSMTATPIPRTLALTIYGDLDLSIINELPKGRKRIITEVVAPVDRNKAYDFVREQVKKGRQVFVICPRIEYPMLEVGSSTIKNNPSNIEHRTLNNKLSWAEVKAVKEEYRKLSEEVFPDLKVGMLHGKMKTKEKEKIMSAFAKSGGLKRDSKNKIDILVSTSVIEVGIDVPNATVMLIEGAERFGLAQLHQFRGRVGRSDFQSYCLLFTDSPAKKTHQRLRALITSENGFELAEKDLKIRGPGDFAGTRQWGIPDLVMSSLKDISLVEKTRQSAKELLNEDPELKKYPLIQEELKKFRERIHLE